jgi:hypothetical protein
VTNRVPGHRDVLPEAVFLDAGRASGTGEATPDDEPGAGEKTAPIHRQIVGVSRTTGDYPSDHI